MKQTSVEWLIERLNLDKTSPNYNELTINKAKEMEKEQMHAEYMRGWKDGLIKQGAPAPPLDRKIYK
jgi:hypothetical protein